MRKQYTFLLVMLLGLLGFGVSARPVTVIIEGGGSVELGMFNWSDEANTNVFTSEMTLGPGTHDLGNISKNYCIVPCEGTTVTYATQTTEGSSYDPTELPKNTYVDGEPYQLSGANSSLASRKIYTITTEVTAPPVTEGVTFTLQNGTAKIYQYVNWMSEGELKAELTAGQSVTLEFINGSRYSIVPEAGYTLTVTDKDGKAVNKQDAQYGPYGVDYVLIPAYNANTFTIVTAEDQRKSEYDVTFNITGGGSVSVKYYDQNNNWALTELATVTNGQSVTLPANETYNVYAADGYDFVSITDANNAAVSLITFETPNYFQINTGDVPSASFNIELKSAGGGDDDNKINFHLNEGGSAALWNYIGASNNTKFADLVPGDNMLELPELGMCYIVANAGATLTVTDDKGNELQVINQTYYYPGPFVSATGIDTKVFNITTTEGSATTYKTVINVAAGSKAKVMEYDSTLKLYKALAEGDNEVEFTNPAGNYYIYGDDDQNLATVTDADGTQLTLRDDSGKKYIQFYLANLSSKYNVVTEGAQPTANPLIVLTPGSQAYYTDSDGVRHDLVEGNNYLDMGTGFNWGVAPWHFYPADGQKFTSFVNANGTEQALTNGERYVSISCNSTSRSSQYTITTAADVAEDPTVKFVVNGGNAELKVYTDTGYETFKALTDGSEDVVLPKNYYYVYAAEGYELESVTDADNNPLTIAETNGVKNVEIDAEDSTPSAQYTITVKATETPANTFIIRVDDASKVNMMHNGWKDPVTLVDGDNEITIDETYRYMFLRNGGGKFYSMTLDGTPVADEYGIYYVYVNDLAGKVLVIQDNYPDEDWTYTIENAGDPVEWSRAAIETIVNNETVYTDIPNFDGTTITARAGSEIRLWAKDADNYDRSATTVTGEGEGNEYLGWYNTSADMPNIMFKLSQPTGKITVTAVKAAAPAEINFHLNEGSAAAIWRFVGVSDNTKWRDLNVGDNMIALPTDAFYYIVANEGATLTVTDDKGTELKVFNMTNYYPGPFVAVTDVETTRFDITTTGGTVVDPDAFEVTLTVNNPDEIKVYTYYSAYDENACRVLDVQLVAGANTIRVPYEKDFQGNNRDWAQLWIGGASHESIVKSVKVRKAGETEWTDGRDNYGTGVYEFYAYPACEIEVEAEHVSYANSCEVFTDFGSSTTIKLVSKDGREITLMGGYQTVHFNASENDFTVEGPANATVYVNGAQISGTTVTLAEGDLVKIFAGSTATVSLDFVVTPQSADAPVKVVNVKTDGRNDVDDISKALELLPGTQVDFEIEAEEGVTFTVTYGEDELTATDGVYTVWPRENSVVTVTYKAPAPVEKTLTLVTEAGETAFTKADNAWTLTLDKLAGSFRVKSDDGSLDLGSNGSPVELGVPYAAAQGAAEDMTLACGEATDVTVTIDAETMAITVTGTVGILTIARDQLDMDAIYFDMAGRRIAARNVENGFYIQVASGVARKIAVK